MKRRFLNFTFLLAAAACLFISCKKEKTSSEPEETGTRISFKVDGVQETFKVNAAATVMTSSDEGFIVMMHAAQDSLLKDSLVLAIMQTGKPFAAGTYTDSGSVSKDLHVLGGYISSDHPDNPFMAGGQILDDSTPRFQIVITSTADGIVTGTFSGTLYDNDGAGPGKVTITDGKFSLPVSNLGSSL